MGKYLPTLLYSRSPGQTSRANSTHALLLGDASLEYLKILKISGVYLNQRCFHAHSGIETSKLLCFIFSGACFSNDES